MSSIVKRKLSSIRRVKQAAEIVELALSESDQILKNLHSKSQLKPHEIIEAKAELKKVGS